MFRAVAYLQSVFINSLLEEGRLGIEIGNGKRNRMLFSDDFVGVSESRESLQNVVYRYCNRCRLKANVGKSAVMVFSKDRVEGRWKWGEHELPKVSTYCYKFCK